MKIYKCLFFVLCIFCSCNPHSDTFSKKDREDLENLWNYFLFGNHAAFVLFGSKPLCEIHLYPQKSEEEQKKIFASLSKELQAVVEIRTDPFSAYDCWQTWKKHQFRYKLHNFSVIERHLKQDPSVLCIFVVHLGKTTQVLHENYAYFKEVFGQEFDPKKEVLTMQKEDSLFWDRILHDHTALGLLFGYGEKNSQFFAKTLQSRKPFENFEFSTPKKIDFCIASKSNFSIPVFRSFNDEKILKQYEKEHTKITEIYEKSDVLEITLKRLTEK